MTKYTRPILIFLVILLVFPSGAMAYSYGDPTKEDVAETFKEIVAKLSASPADWNGAFETYKVRRSEISSHFGESVALTLDSNFTAKDKDLLIANYKAVLVMNLKRRFDYANKDIEDYTKVKLLLAKSKGTFDVLRPYVEVLKPDQVQPLLDAFDKALEAIGNPGLFGVGQKPVQPEEFKKQTDFIYTTVKPMFPYKEAAPKKTEKESDTSATKTTETSSNTANNTATESSAKETSSNTSSESSSSTSSESTETASEAAGVNDSKEAEKVEAEQTESEQQEAEEPTTEQTTAEQSTTERTATEEPKDQDSKSNKPQASGAEHAPMDRSDKTNPVISILVIGGVALVGAGAVIFAKKKGFL